MIGIAAGAMIAGVVITLAVLNPNNHAETSENAADNLLTRRYDVPNETQFNPIDLTEKSRAISEIEWVLARQTTYGRSWKVIQTLTENDSAIIKAEVPVFIFTDDLEVRISFAPSENFDSNWRKVTINVRSVSRIGSTDLGENRRHIEQLLDELDFAFGNDRINL